MVRWINPTWALQEFYVLAQQLPTSGNQVVFKALQTYSDGNVVRWIQTTHRALPEPAHPAPVLTLTAPPSPLGPHPQVVARTPSVWLASSWRPGPWSSGASALALVVRRRGSTGQPSVETTAGSRPLDAHTPSEAER